MENESLKLNELISLQEEALTIYLYHFKSLIQHLDIKKIDKIKIQQIFQKIIEEKQSTIKMLNEIKGKK